MSNTFQLTEEEARKLRVFIRLTRDFTWSSLLVCSMSRPVLSDGTLELYEDAIANLRIATEDGEKPQNAYQAAYSLATLRLAFIRYKADRRQLLPASLFPGDTENDTPFPLSHEFGERCFKALFRQVLEEAEARAIVGCKPEDA